ncbi:MAG TPA: Hsp70 family protein [Polyangiaceae bacterium]|nr:Hsp70 family protein [Polyangiaceae bacterium]
MRAPEYVVGIDLGTTHTVVARARRGAGAHPAIVELPQLVADGSVGQKPLLPSVLFAPLAEEAIADVWGDAPWLIGEAARIRGQRLPGRAVTSPKSWLCHPGIDRLARTLPWGASEDDTPKLSPVEASRRILEHVRAAYDGAHPGHPLAEQELVLTVPASFDEVARELTVRAASEAGLRVRLLEEPLAAFYGYLGAHGDGALRELLAGGRDEAFVLIADVGGGTTDLTLVRVRPDGAHGTRLERVAVGRHLLLGGDNMDLALAHAVEQSMPSLEPSLFAELVLACRTAKERLLGDAPPSSGEETVRVLGRGSQLVGSVHTAKLTREKAESLVVDGFFPLVDRSGTPRETRSGLVGFGLPYERDAAITRHVVAFIQRHLPPGVLPDAVLLNGGVFRAPLVRQRFLDALSDGERRPVTLVATDPDLAVARGAAVFALALAGWGPRIGGGSARGYYIGLAKEGDTRRGICVVPRGAIEGEHHVVRVPGLALVVGQPVRFDLYSSDSSADAPGAVITVTKDFDLLPSMTASFDASTDHTGGRIPVHLEGELTAIGTVDVAAVESSSAASRFRLAFDLRPRAPAPSTAPPSMRPQSRRPSARPDDGKVAAALALVERVFGKGRADADPREARHLVRELEKLVGERALWTTDLSRTLADAVLVEPKARKRSVDHERAFWMLAGYCLRPGYGHPLDERRVGKLVPLVPELVLFPDEARTWPQLWIAWRRVAGGLLEPAQTKLRDLLDPFLSTDEPKPKRPKNVRPQGAPEMLDLAASLERVPSARRAALGKWILERTWRDRDPRLWSALSRVGARVPTYGSAHHVVAPVIVEKWLDHLLRERWAEVPSAARAAAQMARVTGDRTRDVSEPMRVEIAKRLEASKAPAEWTRAVREYVAFDDAEMAEFFGESLPVGLVLGIDSGSDTYEK